jgi:hypothetical protein
MGGGRKGGTWVQRWRIGQGAKRPCGPCCQLFPATLPLHGAGTPVDASPNTQVDKSSDHQHKERPTGSPRCQRNQCQRSQSHFPFHVLKKKTKKTPHTKKKSETRTQEQNRTSAPCEPPLQMTQPKIKVTTHTHPPHNPAARWQQAVQGGCLLTHTQLPCRARGSTGSTLPRL